MRERLERHQAWIYLVAILAGMAVGSVAPETVKRGEVLLWPLLGVLLYATFTQVPLLRIGTRIRDPRFLITLLAGNFVVMPMIVGLLLLLVPDEPAIRLGVLLVLLVPCTDWFISFTHLGRGDAARAIGAAPVLLLVQLVALPFYIWLFLGDLAIDITLGSHLLSAFAGLILLPLALAGLTEKAAQQRPGVQRWMDHLGGLPVPLLATVVFLVAATQIRFVMDTGVLLWSVLAVYLLYLIAAALTGTMLGRLAGLGVGAGRTLIFSLGTRNSFVVLPLALALPQGWNTAAVVIVLQSLVELFGMVAYIRWVPGLLVRDQ